MRRFTGASMAIAILLTSQSLSAEERPRYAFPPRPEDTRYVEQKYAQYLGAADAIISTLIGKCDNKLRFLDGDADGRFVEILSESPIPYAIDREIRLKKYSLAEQMNSDLTEEIEVFYNFSAKDNGKPGVYRVSEGISHQSPPLQGQSNGSDSETQKQQIQWSKWFDARFSTHDWYRDSNIVGADIFWMRISAQKDGSIVATIPSLSDASDDDKFKQRTFALLNKDLVIKRANINDLEFKKAPLNCRENIAQLTDAISFMSSDGFKVIRKPKNIVGSSGLQSNLFSEADKGNADAQAQIGAAYSNGDGVTQDFATAAEWLRKAAEQGHAEAQARLGVLYRNGEGVSQSYSQAFEWLRKAAENGYAKAQALLAVMYSEGEGVQKDPYQAVEWLRKAADQGYAEAQTLLGVRYYGGDGVAKNSYEAASWLGKAADQGNIKAQVLLGVMYAEGEGVTKDRSKAAELLRKAAGQGDEDAKSALEELGLN